MSFSLYDVRNEFIDKVISQSILSNERPVLCREFSTYETFHHASRQLIPHPLRRSLRATRLSL